VEPFYCYLNNVVDFMLRSFVP